jgi:hypothetical protein
MSYAHPFFSQHAYLTVLQRSTTLRTQLFADEIYLLTNKQVSMILIVTGNMYTASPLQGWRSEPVAATHRTQ